MLEHDAFGIVGVEEEGEREGKAKMQGNPSIAAERQPGGGQWRKSPEHGLQEEQKDQELMSGLHDANHDVTAMLVLVSRQFPRCSSTQQTMSYQ